MKKQKIFLKGEKMIFIKYASLFGIIVISSYLGIYKSKEYENRVKELRKFKSALIMFKSKLEFTYEPIKSIFEDISKVIYKNENNIFEKVVKNKNDIYTSWKEAVQNENAFTKEDIEIIETIGKLLGKTDIDGQVSEINLGINLVERQIEIAENEKNKNVKLYKTMGIVCGIGICIILI